MERPVPSAVIWLFKFGVADIIHVNDRHFADSCLRPRVVAQIVAPAFQRGAQEEHDYSKKHRECGAPFACRPELTQFTFQRHARADTLLKSGQGRKEDLRLVCR